MNVLVMSGPAAEELDEGIIREKFLFDLFR